MTFADNDKANFGDASDLQIYHDGSNSWIKDTGTGSLLLTGSTGVFIRGANNENSIQALEDGAVKLYYDNSEKLATSSSGVSVTGHVSLGDSNILKLGTASDLQLYHDGSNSSIQNSTGNLYLYGGGGTIYLKAVNSEDSIVISPNAGVSLYYDNSAKLATTSAGIDVTGSIDVTSSASYGVTANRGFKSTADIPNFTLVESDASGQTWQINSTGAKLSFRDISRQLDRIVIDTAGRVGIGTTSPFAKSHIVDTGWSSGAPYGTVQLIEGNNVNDNNWGHLVITDTTTSTGNGGAISFAIGASSSLDPFAGIKGISEGASYGGLGLFTRASGGTSTERMRINSSGNVGIGRVSSSVVRLSVAGTDATASNYAFEATNSSGATRFIVRNDGQSQFFKSDNSASMTVTSGGNVGIGTTSPSEKLHVSGRIKSNDGLLSNAFQVYNTGTTGFLIELDISSSDYAHIHGTIKLQQFNVSSQQIIDFSATALNNGTLQSYAATADIDVTIKLFVYNSKWYIHVPSPSTYSDISAYVHLGAGYQGGSRGSNCIVGISSAAVPSSGVSGSTDIVAQKRILANTAGNVGIGTTSPNSLADLHVADTSDARIWLDATTGNTLELYAGSGTSIFNRSNSFLAFGQDNVERMRINTGGNVGIGTTSPDALLEVEKPGSDVSTDPKLRITAQTYPNIEFYSRDSNSSNRNWKISSVYNHYGTLEFLRSSAANGVPNVATLAMDKDGNVGIGTTAPAGRLDVQQNTTGQLLARVWNPNTSGTGTAVFRIANSGNNAQGNRIEFTDQQYYHSSISADRTNGLQFGTNATGTTGIATERMRITSTGNVGIGTTSPDQKLSIKGRVSSDLADSYYGAWFEGNSATNGYSFFSVGPWYNGAGYFQRKQGTAYSHIYEYAANHHIVLQAGYGANGETAGGGNVGIGTTSPASKLSVQGDGTVFRMDGTANTTRTMLFRNVGTGEGIIQTDGNMHLLQEDANRYMRFSTANTERMRIDASGKVGIGTSSPASQLHMKHASGPTLTMTRTSTNTSGSIGEIIFGNGDWDSSMASIRAIQDGTNDGGKLEFKTQYNATGGEQTRLIIKRDGNVGIGTSSPSAPLDVVSSSGAVGAYIRGRSSDNIGSLYFTSNSSASTEYGYVQGRSTDLRIQGFNNGLILQPSSGNVGIGTSSPAAALDISQANARGAYLRSSTTGSRLHFLDSTTAAVSTVGIGAEGNNLVLYGGGAEVVRVASSGNVGIGTSSPDGTLHVKDTIAQVYIQSNDGQSAQLIFGDASDASRGRINYDSSDNIIFENSNLTERMRLDSSGNLLVGTTSSPSSSNAGVRIGPSGASGYTFKIANTLTSTFANVMEFINGNGTVGSISTSASATTYNTSSDQRLKENIVDAPSASDDIDAIQVRSFDWKADGSHQKYGMVAQELQSVAPEAVTAPEDPEEMMGVDYSKLVPMLVKEIQSLRARVAELEGE